MTIDGLAAELHEAYRATNPCRQDLSRHPLDAGREREAVDTVARGVGMAMAAHERGMRAEDYLRVVAVWR